MVKRDAPVVTDHGPDAVPRYTWTEIDPDAVYEIVGMILESMLNDMNELDQHRKRADQDEQEAQAWIVIRRDGQDMARYRYTETVPEADTDDTRRV